MAAQTDYASYLRIDELLGLQQPLTEEAHDEMLFIVVHQVYELWFKLILHELDGAASALDRAMPALALPPMQRALAVEQLLIDQLGILETMSPDGFMAFRDPLAPASGFQSTQFREIEALSGCRDGRHMRDPGRSDAQVVTLGQRLSGRSLYDALGASMRALGYDFPDGHDEAARERRLGGLVALYHRHSEPAGTILHQLCEALISHDEAVARWRHHHALMAAREIGSRTGTGGSLGTAYLQTTLDSRFFPELWEVRNRL